MKHCTGRNGTYVCEKPEGHGGKHGCYVRGGVARWVGPYDDMKIVRLALSPIQHGWSIVTTTSKSLGKP